jgi:hypothetical protein
MTDDDGSDDDGSDDVETDVTAPCEPPVSPSN